VANIIQSWLLDPVLLVFLSSLVTIFLLFNRRRHVGRRARSRWKIPLVLGWLFIFGVSTIPGVVNPLLTTLEDQYPASIACEAGSHLVMLGGGVDSRVQSVVEFERMSASTLSRATAAARIASGEPRLRLMVAGGAPGQIAEADVIASYWIALGIEDSRIVRERRSSNTHENALNLVPLITVEPIEGPVRLVTSALHMPRALRVFRKVFAEQGIEFCPVSVGREALNRMPAWAWMPQTSSLVKFDKWLHEIAALAVYRLRGWI